MRPAHTQLAAGSAPAPTPAPPPRPPAARCRRLRSRLGRGAHGVRTRHAVAVASAHASGSACIACGGSARGRGRIGRCSALWKMWPGARLLAALTARVFNSITPRRCAREPVGWPRFPPSASREIPAPDPFADHRFRLRPRRSLPHCRSCLTQVQSSTSARRQADPSRY